MDYTSILGIDVASQKLDLCWDNATGFEYQEIDYSENVLDNFLAAHPNIVPEHCLVGLESTGDYHLKVSKYFLRKGFAVKIINPILTKQYTRTTIRGTKTDKKDSELIHKLISEGHGDEANLSQLLDNDKELLRLSNTITKCATQLKLRLQSTKRKQLDKTERIERKINHVIEMLEDIADEAVKEATDERTDDEKYIDSIPGFAVKLSAIVYHELGNISRFKNVKSLIAYAGLDPRIKQSGKVLNTTGRITKRGSSTLRSGLFMAANVARMHDKELKEYYHKKKAENRSHKEILCMISRKLLHRIFAVLKEQRCYEKR